MAEVREAIDFDMKRWKTQRADLQIELGHLMQKVDYKPDEGLAVLNNEANQFDHAFSGGAANADIDMTAMTNAETGMNGPPSFLTMLERQNRQVAGSNQLKPNYTAQALSPNFFHNRPSSLDDTD